MTATKIQPVAEICSASHDDAQFGERAIKPLRDISGFEYGTPLYAGAAPAAVAGPAWDKTRDSLATLLLGLARRPFLDFDVACIALDAATEPGMPLAYMRGALAAPALEAPAAPATPVLHDIDAGIEVMAWLRENRAPHSIYCKMSACLFGDPDKRATGAAGAWGAAAPVGTITDAMVDAYLTVQRRTVEKADRFGRPVALHTNTVREACRQGLLAAIGAAPAAPDIDQLLDALSQHDDPCEDIADALDRVRTLRAEADRRIRAENTRVDRMAHLSAGVPTSGVLNVLRVALNRANMDYRATGFKQFEIDAAKTWVASAAPAAPAVDASAQVARDAGFNHGVCLALQIMASAGNAGCAEWTELLDCAGRDEIMHYAQHVETESWLLCGFAAVAAQAKEGGASA
ncbi:hypothetical protein [Delftia tsuruhatensis]|uniref:hypothetical protein n=1 Tax=Delftia tsuruhatensis TaxID=180282 RepID=UPI002091345A|nr:hypothetical protein [Delftia tsuruhatensis]MCO5338287.1 hypothetical protein [Delftia tsuruhatensis]MCR4545685.1 hypothetical protein [Delftia tsuruhatensis]